MRQARSGELYRLEVNHVRVRVHRFIDNKWIILEHPDDETIRNDMPRIMELEVRRFDHAMAVWFRHYG